MFPGIDTGFDVRLKQMFAADDAPCSTILGTTNTSFGFSMPLLYLAVGPSECALRTNTEHA